jgi:hypothetical protein
MRTSLLIAMPLILALATPVDAGLIFITPGLDAPNDGSLGCRVVNGDLNRPIQFVRRIFGFAGNVVFNPSAVASTLQPGASSISFSTDNDAKYCIVEVISGPRKTVRVTLVIRDASGEEIVAVEGRP